jgi:CP12 domain
LSFFLLYKASRRLHQLEVAPTPSSNSLKTVTRKKLSMSDIQQQIDQELQEARSACDINGTNSPECAAAWDAVEELQAEAAHQRQNNKPKNSLEQYCDDNPEAAECRIYDD